MAQQPFLYAKNNYLLTEEFKGAYAPFFVPKNRQ